MLAGRWSTDNNGLDILINGTSTGQTTAFDSFLRYTLFSVTTGFVAGVNSLDFVVNNGTGSANPTGLRVEFTTAQATRIPEPGSLLLVGLGLVAAGVLRGRATGVRGAATAA